MMTKRLRNGALHKGMAVTLIFVLLIPLFVWPWGGNQSQAGGGTSDEDARIAAELSNLSGRTTEEILKLRETGLTWNEVSERLKSGASAGTASQKEQRTGLLAETGLGEQWMQEMTDKGYDPEQIMEAKLLAERVQFQLKELVDDRIVKPVVPRPEASIEPEAPKDKKAEAFRKLAEKFDLKAAIGFLLELKRDFGSYEAVLDEYLLSLQLDLSLEDYIADKKGYLEAKERNMTGLDRQSLVTAEDIEMAVLESLQKNDGRTGEEATLANVLARDTEEAVQHSPLPDAAVPRIDDVKPENPTERIRKEIQELTPKP